LENLLQNLLAVRARLLRIPARPASAPAHPAHAAHPAPPIASTHRFFISEQYGIDQRIGALRGFHGARQGLFAAPIHPIGKHDQGLSALLFLHHFVGRQVYRVVEQCAPPPARRREPGFESGELLASWL